MAPRCWNSASIRTLREHCAAMRSGCTPRLRLRSRSWCPRRIFTARQKQRKRFNGTSHEEEIDAGEELRELGRKGFWNVLVAMVVVAIFVCLSEAVLRLGEGRIVSVLSESLIIVAWVTLWGPAETLLFARFPIRRKRAIAHALSQAAVKLRAR